MVLARTRQYTCKHMRIIFVQLWHAVLGLCSICSNYAQLGNACFAFIMFLHQTEITEQSLLQRWTKQCSFLGYWCVHGGSTSGSFQPSQAVPRAQCQKYRDGLCRVPSGLETSQGKVRFRFSLSGKNLDKRSHVPTVCHLIIVCIKMKRKRTFLPMRACMIFMLCRNLHCKADSMRAGYLDRTWRMHNMFRLCSVVKLQSCIVAEQPVASCLNLLWMYRHPQAMLCVLWLGSSVGNLKPQEAVGFF